MDTMETHFENEFPLQNQHETNEVLMFLLLFSTMATKWLPRAFEAILKWVVGVELKMQHFSFILIILVCQNIK